VIFRTGITLLSLLLCMQSLVWAESVEKPLDPLVLQLRWITQTQFAGYYVALDKGMYRKNGLDVIILPGGPNLKPAQSLREGLVDVSIEWLPHALVQREKGSDLVNIAQIFDRSGFTISCRKDHGIQNLEDLQGKRVGSWFVGDEEKVRALLRKKNIKVEFYPQNFNLDELVSGKGDCISTMRYNEYLQLLDKGMQKEEIITFDFDALGMAMQEDGLYVTEQSLKQEGMEDRLVRFVAATIQGWRYTLEHPEEALEIVLDNDPTGALDEHHQRKMLKVVMTLLHSKREQLGQLTQSQYHKTVDQLLEGGVLQYQDSGGYSEKIWNKAQLLLH